MRRNGCRLRGRGSIEPFRKQHQKKRQHQKKKQQQQKKKKKKKKKKKERGFPAPSDVSDLFFFLSLTLCLSEYIVRMLMQADEIRTYTKGFI